MVETAGRGEEARGVPDSDLFREEAVEEYVRGRDRGSLLRISPRWTDWTYRVLLAIFAGGILYSAPFNPSNLSGRTGRGDTCFASYMTWRLNHGIEESLRYAATLTSIKMEKPGPFQGTIAEVLERMKDLS